jgi:hypothetical protein
VGRAKTKSSLSAVSSGAKVISEGASQRLARWRNGASKQLTPLASATGVNDDPRNTSHLSATHPSTVDSHASEEVQPTALTNATRPRPALPTLNHILSVARPGKEQERELRSLAVAHGRKLLLAIRPYYSELAVGLDFESASVSYFNPLRIGSWVVVVHKKTVHIGSGMCLS